MPETVRVAHDPRLIGRAAELEAIAVPLAAARAGMSGVLVLHGDAGIGKSALLRHTVEAGLDLRPWAVAGVEAENAVPYAGLHRLLVPFLDRLDGLPPTHRAALRVACGLADGPPADTYLVGLAALSLLAEEARRGGRLLIVDDAEWLDRESLVAITFLARRVHAEGLALVIASRAGPDDLPDLAGLPAMEITGLDAGSALELLREVVDGPLDTGVVEQVVATTAGNPLALTDLGAELSAGQLGGRAPLPSPIPVGRHLEDHYLRLLHALPPPTQAWLVLAAAEPTGDEATVDVAAGALGLDADAAGPAEAAGLVVIGTRVAFRHALVRSAIYGGATSVDRRKVHEALADATTRPGDIDRRAWHRAAACIGTDEEVAAELERAAGRAAARGGHAARATFLTRAAELTPPGPSVSRRLVAAAGAASAAGALLQARSLLDRVDRNALGPTDRGHLLSLAADIALSHGEPGSHALAAADFLAAATAFGIESPRRTRTALLRTCERVITAEHLGTGTSLPEIVVAIRARVGPDPSAVPDLILAAFAALVTEEHTTAIPRLREAVAALLDPTTPDDELLECYLPCVTFCTIMWEDRMRDAVLAARPAWPARPGTCASSTPSSSPRRWPRRRSGSCTRPTGSCPRAISSDPPSAALRIRWTSTAIPSSPPCGAAATTSATSSRSHRSPPPRSATAPWSRSPTSRR